MSVSLPGQATALDSRIIATTKELSAEFPFNKDTIGGDVLGVGELASFYWPCNIIYLQHNQGWSWATIGGGMRSSSATAYLAPVSGRPNLDIVINAQATKLVMTGKVNGLPSFHSVEVAEKAGGKRRSASAFVSILNDGPSCCSYFDCQK